MDGGTEAGVGKYSPAQNPPIYTDTNSIEMQIQIQIQIETQTQIQIQLRLQIQIKTQAAGQDISCTVFAQSEIAKVSFCGCLQFPHF